MLENEFIEFSMGVFRAFGLDEVSSMLISVLFIEPKELSTDELCEKTGYSMASISNKMKFLMAIGMVDRIKKKGSKRVYYFMDKDITKMIKKKIKVSIENQIEPAKRIIPKLIEKYRDSKEEKERKQLIILKNYIKQIRKLEEIYEKIGELMH